jgi:serine/threonine-protein kinase
VAARPKAVKPADAAQPEGRKPAATADAQARDALIGRTLGRCRIEELIGVGRTARVYRAHYEAFDDVVAIKVLRSDVAKNPTLRRRFETEARSIAKVDNENVLKIYDVGKEHGLHFMVVELLEGEEILDLINREGQVELMDALRIVRQAANGLKAAHAHGLVHRDVKPQNLFLLEDGTVKVVDFGLAGRIDDDSERVGTPHYMAPEVCEAGNAEFASDIYALGIVLYHLLVGQPPYAGRNVQGILKAHIDDEPLRPERKMPGGLPREVAELVRELTKRDPLLRPTATELIETLDTIGGKDLKQKETLEKRRGRSRARSAVLRRQRAGRKAPAMAAIAGAIAVVAVIAVLVTGGEEPSGPQQPSTAADTPSAMPGSTPLENVTAVETAEEKEAREKRAAETKLAAEAQAALDRSHAYARETWHSPADTNVVRGQYAAVANKYKGTPAGELARQIASDIRRKKRHPHPDREWSSADAIEAAREQWDESKSEVERRIAAHDYPGARGLLPPQVSDESGTLARELDFWRTYVRHLDEFQAEFIKAVMKLPEDQRTMKTPKGEGTIKRINRTRIDVQVGHAVQGFDWKEIEASEFARLARDAFREMEDVRFTLLRMAYAWAHRLENMFWDTELEFGSTSGSGAYSREARAYSSTFEKRLGG